MIARTSLLDQKRIQWAKEREEMTRFGGNWGLLKNNNNFRMTLAEIKQSTSKPICASGHFGSSTSLKSLNYNSESTINLQEEPEVARIRHRNPSLPPIYNKDQQLYISQSQQKEFPLKNKLKSQHNHRLCNHETSENHYTQVEDQEGETSGYASDSMDVPVSSKILLPGCKPPEPPIEKIWRNPYSTPESSLPPSRRLQDRMGELNRPRWDSVWGQDTSCGDPPPPSWLARLGHSSQVLVINHESASSSDSSTVGSTGCEKTYLRGQNIPVDANVLQEREIKRQKALELQTAIKRQLEEKNRMKKEEKERKLEEERLEEERIKREREKEKERFDEEQRRQRERDAAKLKESEAMREVLQAAERLAKEQKKILRKNKSPNEENSNSTVNFHSIDSSRIQCQETPNVGDGDDETNRNSAKELEKDTNETKSLQVPVSKDVAIVLSGRLEDSELLNGANLQFVNLVLTPTPRNFENKLCGGLNFPSTVFERRLVTPTKFRAAIGRDFGTQTDLDVSTLALRGETRDAGKRGTENGATTGEISMKAFPRSKSQPRTSIESRPQWNANRPCTRYRTQSEKDPHYQRRLRMRRRVESSDERSRSPSLDRRKSIKLKIRPTRRKIKPESYDADLSMDSLNSIVRLRTDEDGLTNIETHKYEPKNLESRNETSSVWDGEEILSKLSSLKTGLLSKQMEWKSERLQVSPAASTIF
ncbi:uncharacterized protein LOC143348424 [Colletes latitarsis]|uniref:uncharacterized protein LOC143348424 n=1 Tax=Colletes latitarsis TaxID=2605962 RepID=UPI004034FCB7